MSLIEISKISTQLLLQEPFYGHFMMGIPKELSIDTPTACVSLLGKSIIKLRVNPDFWATLKPDHQYGLIKHEVLHLVMKHLFLQKDFTNKRLFNIACDLVVNQYINYSQLPEGAILLSTFDNLTVQCGIELEPWKSTGYYYRKLQSILQDPDVVVEGSFLGDLMNSTSNEHLDKHSEWYRFEDVDKAAEKIMEYQLYNQVKGVMDRMKSNPAGLGHLPSQLLEYLNSFLDSYVPQVDWKRELRKFATSSNSSYVKNTLRRPSKRYGTSPGIKIKRRNRLLIVLDTSGSVPIEDIQIFFGELHQIWKAGAEVIITECDADVKKTYDYKGVVPESITGRGGTNFTPPIILANQQIKPDGIIYFTDGFAHAPSVRSRASILWVITSNGITDNDDEKEGNIWHQLPGKKVKMHG